MKKILNFGSLNADYVYTTDHIVRGGETTSSTGMEIFPGGKGLNQTIALARAGLAVHHAGLIGDDGAFLLDTLKADGVDTRFVGRIEGRGGHTIIQVDKNAQNAILLFGGSNRAVTAEYADEVLSHFSAGDLLLMQNEISAVPHIIDRAFEKGMEIWLNPSPMDEGVFECDLTKVSGFFLNEIEGAELTGSDDPETILNLMVEKFPRAAVVLTLGENGAWYAKDGMRVYCPAEKTTAVDTTAAGDTFTGYFLRGMLDGLSPAAALQLAAKASAVTVSRSGASPSIPKYEELCTNAE
ncbi:MAG: ribokinase [Clostridia bacterium]|nr:ribokinase [Clostridia bacterium]